MSSDQRGPERRIPDDQMICYCMLVEAGRIRAAIEAGAHDVESLQYATAASTCCGSCRLDLIELLDEAGIEPAEPPTTPRPE